jgi:hypothetical protein
MPDRWPLEELELSYSSELPGFLLLRLTAPHHHCYSRFLHHRPVCVVPTTTTTTTTTIVLILDDYFVFFQSPPTPHQPTNPHPPKYKTKSLSDIRPFFIFVIVKGTRKNRSVRSCSLQKHTRHGRKSTFQL